MKKILVAFMALCFSATAFGFREVTVRPGEEKGIHVGGGNVVIKYVQPLTNGTEIAPIVNVVSEDGGFTCDILSVMRTDVTEGSEGYETVYEIEVDWSPGSDSSGCVIEIENPATDEVASVMVYMSY
jgi:hypothetical protein